MPAGPRISVILPVYNAAATLARAIASIQSQRLTDWELIAIDDGSTDPTAAILAEAAAADLRIRPFHTPHRGLIEALNRGITESRAPFLARMDADDECHPDRLSIQARHLDARPEVGLVTSRVRFGGNRQAAPGYARYVDWNNRILSAREIRMNRFVESPVAHPSVLFRRELPDRFGGYRETGWPEDYELWLRWLEAGVRMEKRPEHLVIWFDSPDRLSRNHQRYRVDAFYSCKTQYLARWIHREIPADRPVVLWGAGRVTRRRFHSLIDAGVPLAGYIDINPRTVGQSIAGRPVRDPDAIPTGDAKWFVIGGVGNQGARETIREALQRRGYVEGIDYLMAA